MRVTKGIVVFLFLVILLVITIVAFDNYNTPEFFSVTFANILPPAINILIAIFLTVLLTDARSKRATRLDFIKHILEDISHEISKPNAIAVNNEEEFKINLSIQRVLSNKLSVLENEKICKYLDKKRLEYLSDNISKYKFTLGEYAFMFERHSELEQKLLKPKTNILTACDALLLKLL